VRVLDARVPVQVEEDSFQQLAISYSLLAFKGDIWLY
jgi:hypothetical protein